LRLIGILSWYDEHAAWLAGSIASLAKAEVSHLIAVDGAYGLYPNGRGYSGPSQHQVIIETTQALQMGCTIHTPAEPWFGNEVEKRNFAFQLAEQVAEPNEDWYFLIDADHFVATAIGHTKVLAETDCDVAEVRFFERYGGIDSGGMLRCIFRAVPGLRFDTNHFTYRLPDGRNLHETTEPVAGCHMIEVEHRTMNRDRWRKELQQSYYTRRDELRVEYPREEHVPS
jgi:hypothetical protein